MVMHVSHTGGIGVGQAIAGEAAAECGDDAGRTPSIGPSRRADAPPVASHLTRTCGGCYPADTHSRRTSTAIRLFNCKATTVTVARPWTVSPRIWAPSAL